MEARSAAFGMNANPSRRIGTCAIEAMFGIVPRLNRALTDSKNGEELTEKLREVSLSDNWLRRRDLHKTLRESLVRYENSRETLKEGQLVWIRKFGRKEFSPRWLVPATITEVRTHSVKVHGENGMLRVLNRGDLQPYQSLLGSEKIGEDMKEVEEFSQNRQEDSLDGADLISADAECGE